MKRKKGLRIVFGVVLLVVGVAIFAPVFLQAKFGAILREKVNQNIQGQFDFESARLSLFRDFPNARVSLQGVSLTTLAPFEGDTLFAAREAYLVMGIRELFKGAGQPIGIREIYVEGADLRLEVDAQERVNYLIAKTETQTPQPADPAEGFTFQLQQYALVDGHVSYTDLASGLSFSMGGIQHNGSGDLAQDQSELRTHTEATVSLIMDSTAYLENNHVELDALLGIDLSTDTYRFLDGKGKINQMPLVVDGFVQLVEDGQEVDLTFGTPSSEFRNFLALVPGAYAQNLEGVEARGQFVLEGRVQGRNTDPRIPGFEIRMEASDAAFRYPSLPKGMDDIQFRAAVYNTTGLTEDTYLEIPTARFRIDRDEFALSAVVRSLTGNPRVEAALKGTLNLEHLSQAYPVDLAPGMSGLLTADLTTAFDMAAVEARRYQDTRTSGTLGLRAASIQTESFGAPVRIEAAQLRFNPASAQLEKLSGSLGQSDFQVSGTLRDYLGYALADARLQGDFTLESRKLVVSDFQSSTGEGGTSDTEGGAAAFSLPEDLDLRIKGKAAEVLYDSLPMRNVSGTLLLKDARLQLQDVRSDMLDGAMALNAALTAREGKPVFEMDLGLDGFRIGEAMESLELFRTLAPVASLLEGRLNSKLRLSGALQPDFSPDLMALSGNVVAEVLASRLSGKKPPVVEALDARMDFIDMDALDLKGLKTALAFENGRVAVRPFQFAYRDITVNVEGGHTFDQQLTYTATLDVPAKYLGNEVNRLITELQEPGLKEATVPVGVSIGGTYTAPTVQTDLKQAVTGLTSRLVEAQKQKLLATGKDKAQQLIGNILKEETDRPATPADSARTRVGDLVQGVLGGKQSDSTRTKQDTAAPAAGGQVKQAARNILGGLLGKKKDTAQVKKDSVQ
ncbi:AsmA-like C-terminal region-containing protein [Robiginitalea sediminis]|uniref:AsmA-like C-terminal region-containing protein n=1 Tax=Robiginitalea sediminis TaxID=1982593 RepID=UPI000B4B39FA|nr:AsmA-like C-terminal region-containing protein [Robiginitalea sediminis]